ncbi:hypothetical protein GVN24_34990 [Rhizobium sp. CRIBSB]|nr:hypothetical protein [Rhizobium sp. CRIBSB]
MKKFLIAAGVASLLIAAQAVASDVAGVSEGAPRVTDRLAASYNASLNASTTQTGGTCSLIATKNTSTGIRTIDGEGTSVQNSQECEALRQQQLQQLGPTGWTVAATFVAATVIVLDDEAQTD